MDSEDTIVKKRRPFRRKRLVALGISCVLAALFAVLLACGGGSYLCIRFLSGTPIDRAAYDSAEALGKQGTSRSLSLLLSALEVDDPEVRSNALCGLRTWQGKRGADPRLFRALAKTLREALDGPEPFFPSSVLCVLIAKDGESTLYPREELLPLVRDAMGDSRTRSMAICGLRDCGPDTGDIDAIVGCLRDSDANVRWMAATAMAQLGLVKRLPELQEAMQKEKDARVKGEMETAIRQLTNLCERKE